MTGASDRHRRRRHARHHLRRPEKKNAITQDMYRAMSDAIDTAQNNPAIRCLIITGGSGVFTAGNDLDDFLKDGTDTSGAARARNATKFLYSLAHNVKPIIAAVDGIAIGIGTTLLFHCDYVLASTSRDVLDAVHPARPGAGRRLQPADTAHHGPPARLRHAGDGPQGERRTGPRSRLRQRRRGARPHRGRSPQSRPRTLRPAGRSRRDLPQAAAPAARRNRPAGSIRKAICSANG